MPRLSRRGFIQRVATVGVAALAEGRFSQARAETITHSSVILTGTHFDLAIELITSISQGAKGRRSK